MVRSSLRQLKGLDQEQLKREVERLEDAGLLSLYIYISLINNL